MADEKEDINNKRAENNEEPAHHSLVGDIIDKIEEVIANMDTDFPLSGGEEHPVHLRHDTEDESKDKPDEEIKEEPAHHSLAGDIIEKIEEVIENMDTDFPLSGGEEHPIHHKHHTEDEPEDNPAEDHHKKTSFRDDIDTEYPLSGGEVER